ncbi:putative iron uptake ABC transporter substrate-binding protein [Actinacidiphila reveromycinica]|uniref:Putative iron uptake ABC transporter substrate-binding protein n=1 Tax=Actinacidiphila reveromycinica TaxID=659352 RepID=A0A7U3V0L5_9ACTN|nr:ABC transporter substrate-binding protein [Streptomyces sp. SN-593]BBB02294.1 putative iron uptake ABC transporter substrate-binding protein [Streptomyces sp. SN-593]
MHSTTRTPRRAPRALAVAAAALGLLLGAAACGSDGHDDAGGAGTPAASSSTGTSTGFPLTVKDSQGGTTLKAAPKKVVALTAVDLDAALAASVVPVLAPSNPFSADGSYPWLKGKLTAATQLVPLTTTPPFEKIAALSPDLILDTGDYAPQDTYGKLSEIAPTLAPLASAAADTWQDRQRQIGRALGRSEQSDAAITSAQNAVTTEKAEHPGLAGRTFSVTYAADAAQIVTLSSPQDFAVRFLQSLGLKQAPALTALAKNSNGVGMVSKEKLDLLSADLMLAAYQTPALEKEIGRSPLMASAAKGHTLQEVDLTTITLLRNPSTLGLPWVLDQLDPSLAKTAS